MYIIKIYNIIGNIFNLYKKIEYFRFHNLIYYHTGFKYQEKFCITFFLHKDIIWFLMFI